jgi:ankyrin repeat protein
VIMESPRAPGNHEDEALSSDIQSQPKLAGHVGELTGPSHRYNNTTARDNARVQYGDQYHHYHAVPARELTAREVEVKQLEELLEALAFPQMSFRFAAIANAYSSTCQWMFGTPQFLRWRDRSLTETHHGLFWLRGKPGSGKSTVTKCAVEYAKRTLAAEKTIYFFFNARGDSLGKTVEGMLRSLLHQMVQDVPSLFGALRSEELATYSSQGWSCELLTSLFRQAVCELSKDGQLTCYIDALDEGEEDEVRKMVEFLEELLEHAMRNDLRFSVYLASRHYPNISVRHSEEVLLDDHAGHHKDISTYVRNRLKCRPASMQTNLATEIMRRSSGVFLWVVLVIRELNKQSDRGNHHRLQSHLQALPSGLNDLFQRIVYEGGISEYMLPALQIVMFAYRALGPLELYFAIMSITESSSRHSVVWDHDAVDERLAIGFITSSSKGLLEVVLEDRFSEHLATKTRSGSVQFIHESVREYLLGSGMEHLDPNLPENTMGEGNLRLARWCRGYITLCLQHIVIPQVQIFGYCRGEIISSSCPFFPYAWVGILVHSETAACYGAVVLEPFEELLQSHLWLFWDEVSKRMLQLSSTRTVLHIFAHENCTSLISQQLKRYPPHHLYQYIDADCPGGYPGIYAKATMNHTALQIAVARRFPDIVELLLSHGANVNVSCQKGDDHPLHIMALEPRDRRREREEVKIIELLLRYGVEVDLRNSKDQTALHEMASGGDPKILKTLLQNGADPNAKDFCLFTPLHMTTTGWEGSVDIARTLIRHGADLNARDINHDTPLHNGAYWGNVRICKLVLEYGADVNVRNQVGETPLHYAAAYGGPDTCYLLLQWEADVNACDNESNTPLRFAIQSRDIEAVIVLLVHGAEVSSLYARVKGGASFMDRLRETGLTNDCVSLRLVAHCKDIPVAARSQAKSTLEKIVMEGEFGIGLPKGDVAVER